MQVCVLKENPYNYSYICFSDVTAYKVKRNPNENFWFWFMFHVVIFVVSVGLFDKSLVSSCMIDIFFSFTIAPPQLTNVFNYPKICTPPVLRNSCTTSPISYVNQNVDLTVTYNSTGPVAVRWFVNDLVVNCPSAYNETINHHCIGIYTSSTVSNYCNTMYT